MISDIFPFVFGKLVVAVLLFFLYFWPLILFVGGLALIIHDTSSWSKRTKSIAAAGFAVLFILFYGSYLHLIWPDTPSRTKCGCTPSDAVQYLFQGYDKYKEKKVEEEPPLRTDGPIEIQRYMLVDWNPPKHFYVTLKNMKTGHVVENAYVSKHCNNSSSLQRNVEYNLQVQTYTLSNKPGIVFYEFKDLYSAFC